METHVVTIKGYSKPIAVEFAVVGTTTRRVRKVRGGFWPATEWLVVDVTVRRGRTSRKYPGRLYRTDVPIPWKSEALDWVEDGFESGDLPKSWL